MGGGGAAIGIICVVVLIALPVGLMIGALILRAAVSIANKCLPQASSRYEEDWDDDEDWDDRSRSRRRRGGPAIPEPTFGRAMGIVFVVWIINFVVGLMMGVVAGGAGMANNQGAMLALQGFSTVVNFVIGAAVLSSMLPTSFPRACLVVLFQFLIAIALALIIIVPLVLVLGIGLGGLR